METEDIAIVGAVDHGSWMILVTVSRGGNFLDRRRVELLDADLPSYPHHHEGQVLPLQEAVKLVQRVRKSAERHAATGLEALAESVPMKIAGLAIRAMPELPPTVAERITDYRSQNMADSAMYREILAAAARALGWSVSFYDPKRVAADAAKVLGLPQLDSYLEAVGRSIGPPWQKDQKVAMTAAIAASGTS